MTKETQEALPKIRGNVLRTLRKLLGYPERFYTSAHTIRRRTVEKYVDMGLVEEAGLGYRVSPLGKNIVIQHDAPKAHIVEKTQPEGIGSSHLFEDFWATTRRGGRYGCRKIPRKPRAQ